MASDVSVDDLTRKLESSLASAANQIPTDATIAPPTDGISLLDVKTELFLSYLQNLVFLILFKLQNSTTNDEHNGDLAETDIVKKLSELRVYLERGVRPLENKLKYQIDKVVRAAETNGAKVSVSKAQKSSSSKINGEGEEHTSDSDDGESADELAYRPNISAFSQPQQQSQRPQSSSLQTHAPPSNGKSGIYKPPRINATAMPTPSTSTDPDKRQRAARIGRASAVDDFIASEMRGAPEAAQSVGSTILAGGRRTKTAKERRDEDERLRYEEANFVRLPKEGRKERGKRDGGRDRGGWGGEELRALNSDLGRIARLTGKRGHGGDDMGGGKRRR